MFQIIVLVFLLGKVIDSHQTESLNYEVRLSQIERKLARCEQVTNYEARIRELEARLSVELKRGSRAESGNVSFSTLLTIDQTHIGLGQTIKFDRVLLNDGSGYSVHSGVFTAPVSGVYMFVYHFAHGGSAGQVWLELMCNGNKINAGVTDPFHLNQDLQGGNTAIIRVNIGDQLWLESFHQNDATLYGTEGFTSFSGVLLY